MSTINKIDLDSTSIKELITLINNLSEIDYNNLIVESSPQNFCKLELFENITQIYKFVVKNNNFITTYCTECDNSDIHDIFDMDMSSDNSVINMQNYNILNIFNNLEIHNYNLIFGRHFNKKFKNIEVICFDGYYSNVQIICYYSQYCENLIVKPGIDGHSIISSNSLPLLVNNTKLTVYDIDIFNCNYNEHNYELIINFIINNKIKIICTNKKWNVHKYLKDSIGYDEYIKHMIIEEDENLIITSKKF